MNNRLLNNRYKIITELGEGGMAIVYKALDTQLEREVAVKILHAHMAKHEEFCKRFHQEAAIAAKLVHPNIVQVYDYGKSEDGRTFIVSELIRGQNFHQLQLEKLKQDKKPFPVTFCVMVCVEILKALELAHGQNYIHRDIKPDNVMISTDGSVKLTDFGIAKNLDTSLTITGNFLGSPVYSSPEQVQGSHVDFRTDLYSVGIILYESLTARLPFSGNNAPEVMMRIVQGNYVGAKEIVPSIPEFLDSFINCALEKEKNNRFETTALMKNELIKFLEYFKIDNCKTGIALYFENKNEFIRRFTKSLANEELKLVTSTAKVLEQRELQDQGVNAKDGEKQFQKDKPFLKERLLPSPQGPQRKTIPKKIANTQNLANPGPNPTQKFKRNTVAKKSNPKLYHVKPEPSYIQWILIPLFALIILIIVDFSTGRKLLNRLAPSNSIQNTQPNAIPTMNISVKNILVETPLAKKTEVPQKPPAEPRNPVINNYETKVAVKPYIKPSKKYEDNLVTSAQDRSDFYNIRPTTKIERPQPTPVPITTILPTAAPAIRETPQATKIPESKFTLQTMPFGASISVDGVFLGATNADGTLKTFEVSPGKHILEIHSLDVYGTKYRGIKKTITIEAGATLPLGVATLTPYRTLTLIITGRNVKVRVNNVPYNKINGKPLVLTLPEGKFTIIATAENGKSHTETIQLKEDNHTLSFSLE